MSDSSTSTMARRGVSYLLAVGVAGVLMAGFYFVEAVAEFSAGRLVRGFTWLVVGVAFAAAAAHVLKLWRERRSATKPPG